MVSFVGHVIKISHKHTIKVRVERIKVHPVVLKPVRYHRNYLVHDKDCKSVVGDIVRIDTTHTKIDGFKNFELGGIVTPAARYIDSKGVLHTQKADEEKMRYMALHP